MTRLRKTLPLLLLAVTWAGSPIAVGAGEGDSPFDKLAGRWVGGGKLVIADGTTETVKCRVTYLVSQQGAQVRQTIRCAAASGSIEVQSTVSHARSHLSGTWRELSRDMSGDATGTVTPDGFELEIKGSDVRATMHVAVKGAQQIIDVDFVDSALTGLKLELAKG
jgi:hypothetical protein